MLRKYEKMCKMLRKWGWGWGGVKVSLSTAEPLSKSLATPAIEK